jgi:hypothetical protein
LKKHTEADKKEIEKLKALGVEDSELELALAYIKKRDK